MTPIALDKETIVVRLNGIEGELAELYQLAKRPFEEFENFGDPFKLAQYHLHRALEGVFNIGGHILSRLPGGNRGGAYKEIARLLGEKKIVPQAFAMKNLVKMAGYRNRLVHFYAEIAPKEIYDVLQENLSDFEVFLKSVKAILKNPAKYGLTVN